LTHLKANFETRKITFQVQGLMKLGGFKLWVN
jgi:hypothetical protein